MRLDRQAYQVLRWGIPLVITGLGVGLLGHQSKSPLFFARYSPRQVCLLIGMGILSFISWRIAVNNVSSLRLIQRLRWLPVISILLSTGCVLAFLDIVYRFEHADVLSDLFYAFLPMLSVFPFGIAIMLWILAEVDPKESFRQMTLGLCFTFIGIFLLEGIFRVLVKPEVPSTEYEFERLIAFRWPQPILLEKPLHIFRILGLADSYGIAGESQNYYNLLEAALQQTTPHIELVNLSRSGYNLYEEQILFTRFGSRYQPDLVLHGVYVGNDFENELLSPQHRNFKTYRGLPIIDLGGGGSFRPRNLFIVQWIERYTQVLFDQQMRQAEQKRGEVSGTFAQANFLSKERAQMEVCLRHGMLSETTWPRVAARLDAIRSAVAQSGAAYVMIIHPDQFQVEAPLRELLQQQYHLNLDNYDFDLPQKFLRQYCVERNILYLDLLPIFRSHGMAGGLYRLHDTHYNDAGNILTAESLRAFLMTHHIVKEPL